MYKPLPESLTIQQSGINGLGLFAKESLKQRTNLGMTHLKLNGNLFRTPLGGFINHSDTPNCIKICKDDPTSIYIFLSVGDKDIEVGEELTVKYTFYKL